MKMSGKDCKTVEPPLTEHLIFKCSPIDEKIICFYTESYKID